MLDVNQQLKLKYPRLNIVEDYPDGTMILLDSEQCRILSNTLEIFYIKPELVAKQHSNNFIEQLQSYLSTKERI